VKNFSDASFEHFSRQFGDAEKTPHPLSTKTPAKKSFPHFRRRKIFFKKISYLPCHPFAKKVTAAQKS
jgi:hypothetical protein